MKLYLIFFLFLFSAFSIAATDPQKAYSLLKEGKAILVDVREKDELKSGMIDRAIWFPRSKLDSDPSWKEEFLKLAKDKKIFLYCRTGRRSTEFKNILQKDGIESESLGGFDQLKTILPSSPPK